VVPNPIGLAGLENPEKSTVGAVLFGLVVVSMVAAVVSLVIRFRRSRGDERQQLKWFACAGALLPLLAISDIILLPDVFIDLLFAVLTAFLPVAAGIAILRYRLYDIDALINRTLVYAALTLTLGVAYVGSVLLLQTALRPFTSGSDIAVAVSTLAVVALFQPLRRRIQDWVDRRFYRSRYDAQRTLDEFSSRLREEVDLAQLEGQLVTAVERTIRPTHASLWLRPGR
jgi:hypothetical protein